MVLFATGSDGSVPVHFPDSVQGHAEGVDGVSSFRGLGFSHFHSLWHHFLQPSVALSGKAANDMATTLI